MFTSLGLVLIRLTRGSAGRAALCLMAALALASPARAVPMLDGNEDFKLLASRGFEVAVDGAHSEGSVQNDYAWSMAWFKGKLYVGTGRFVADPATGVPTGGQIWAYTPGGADGATGTWALAYEAPNLLSLPREFGYRWMTSRTFRGTEYLFVSTLGPLQGNILYTADGVTFQPVSRAGFPTPAIGFRTMVCFTEASGKTVLVTTPVGRFGTAENFDSDRTDNPIVLANDDPVRDTGWRNYSPLRMGDPTNDAFFSMQSAGGWLYAGVMNEVTGAQLWRTRGCPNTRQNCAPTWTKVIDRGGGRPPKDDGIVANSTFADMVAHGSDLYLALSRPALQLAAVTAELWRLRTDATFEVMIGAPRVNVGSNPALPANLHCGHPLEDLDGSGGANDCPPTTRQGAGYGIVGSAQAGYPDGVQLYFWRLFHYGYSAAAAPLGDNRLYMGTLQGIRGGLSTFGFDILASADGVGWTTVSRNGLGNWQQQGMRSIAASPYGLFVGGTHFTLNYTGEVRGCSVWLGAPAPDSVAPISTITSPPSPAEGATIGAHSATFAWTAADTPVPGSLPMNYAFRLDPLEPLFSAFAAVTTKTYSALPNGAYTFYVIARDAAANTEAPGAAPGAANRRAFTIDAPDLPPTAAITTGPGNPSASPVAQFTWGGSDDLTPAANLLYDYWLSPLQSDPGTFAGTTAAVYANLGDGPYTFHVKARDGANNVGPETTLSFTVAVPPTPPVAPTPAAAALLAPRVVRVTWTDVPTETRYDIERCTLAGRKCNFAPLVGNLPANVVAHDDVLAAAGSFGYRVRACNGNGCSAWAPTEIVAVP